MAIEHVGVVGSGIMGSGIAEVVAKAGRTVMVRSRTPAGADAVVAGVDRSLSRQVQRGNFDDEQCAAILARLQSTTELADLADCDLVIESIVEDLAAKKHLFYELDRVCKPHTVLATDTSTLSVTELAMETGRPDKVCGLHFFNPPTTMPLVEVVRALTTSDETLAEARELAEACGKTVVDVADRPGFVVNALLFPYLNNAVRMLDSGIANRDGIDAAMRGGCNFPMGPFELLDLVGLDTSLSILEALHAESGDANHAPAPLLRRMVSVGRLGRKSGEGFHRYAS